MDFLWKLLYQPTSTVVDMKTSLATTISIVGVLAAGGVALAVNSSVLDSATMTAENAPALQAEIVALTDTASLAPADQGGTLASQSNGVDDPAPSASVPEVQPTETTVVAPATPSATSVQSAYNVQGFGVVTLAQGTGSLTVVSVAPESTVKYTTKQESPTRIEVFFVSSAGVSIKFHADVIDGRIVTSVMNEPGPRIGGHTKREDDHDGDRDEDHDEDHESGEHDDD